MLEYQKVTKFLQNPEFLKKRTYMKNSKFKVSQHSTKQNTSYHILILAEIWIDRINENAAINDDKITNISKKLEIFIPFKS